MEAEVVSIRPKRARKLPPITRLTSHFWRERLTRPGQSIVVAAAVSAIAIGFPDTMAGTIAFSFFAAGGIVALFFARRAPAAKITRHAPKFCMVGSVTEITYTLENPTKETILDVGAYEYRLPGNLRWTEAPQYLDQLPPGQSHDFTFSLLPTQRGLYELPGPSVISSFPFAVLQSRRMEDDPHRLVVYPPYIPLREIRLRTGRRYQPGGVSHLSKIAESMEFRGTREYRFGDRVRDLHPRSWARVGYPVVRQYQQEFLSRVAILVDTYLPWEWFPMVRQAGQGMGFLMESRVVWGRDRERLEANLSLAAAVAEYFARTDCVVELFAAGPQLYRFESGRSLAHLENILEILACLEACKEDPIDRIAHSFHEKLGQTSSVVALLLHWDEKRRAMLDAVQGMGVEVKPVLICDHKNEAEEAIAYGALHLSVDRALRGVQEI